jgi:hypothetical protein
MSMQRRATSALLNRRQIEPPGPHLRSNFASEVVLILSLSDFAEQDREGYCMKTFDSLRRDLLRTGSLGLAAAALPTVSYAASKGKAEGSAAEGIFNVRKFGATGDGKTVDYPRSESPN